MIKKSATLSILLLFLVSVISCEKDFTDIDISIIGNSVFSTNTDSFKVDITPANITAVRAGGLSNTLLGEYLLGIYKSQDFKTIKASFVSQVGYVPNLRVIDLENIYNQDTIVVTRMDTVLIRIPYQTTQLENDANNRSVYKFDSILGNSNVPVSIKVYRNLSFLNILNPQDITETNTYLSNTDYIEGEELSIPNLSFTKPPQNSNTQDTIIVFKRHLSTGERFNDTIKAVNKAPFFSIALDTAKIKSLFLDKYQSAKFASQDAFQNYFRGLIVEVAGDDGVMIPFDFITNPPTLEIYYTNTILKNNQVIDTVPKKDVFGLAGIRNSIYDGTYPQSPGSGRFTIQGTVGTMANIDILSLDSDGNGISDLEQLKNLDAENGILINDASLVFYVDQEKDTTNLPLRLFLFKNGNNKPSLIRDIFAEGGALFGGTLLTDANGAADRYHFRITDYISDIVNGISNDNPPLGLRVFNITNLPTTASDTLVNSYNWNPRGVVLHSNTSENITKRVKLKISYSKLNN